jgi:hypothetical protein
MRALIATTIASEMSRLITELDLSWMLDVMDRGLLVSFLSFVQHDRSCHHDTCMIVTNSFTLPSFQFIGSEFRIARTLLRRIHIMKERRERREALERQASLRKRQREEREMSVRSTRFKSELSGYVEGGDRIPVLNSFGCRVNNTSSVMSETRFGVSMRATGDKLER